MRKTLPWIYLILAILGAVLPWRANLEFMAESSGSFDFQRFVADASATAAAHSTSRTLFSQNSRSQSSRSQRSSLMTSLLQPGAGHQLQEDRFTPAHLDLEETGEAVNETDGSLAKSKAGIYIIVKRKKRKTCIIKRVKRIKNV